MCSLFVFIQFQTDNCNKKSINFASIAHASLNLLAIYSMDLFYTILKSSICLVMLYVPFTIIYFAKKNVCFNLPKCLYSY